MRRLLRALFVVSLVALFVIAALPSDARADRCTAHCRERARACKDRCKLGHPEGASPSRHRCLQSCELHEHECRAGC
jgi:hypothetical protein